MRTSFDKPSYKYGNPVSRNIGTSGKQPTFLPTSNWLVREVVPTQNSSFFLCVALLNCAGMTR